MTMIKLKQFVVYMFPTEQAVQQLCGEKAHNLDLEYATINPQIVTWLFDADKQRRTTFMKFLRQGHKGIIWYSKDEWASYAWISLPETSGPSHLPRQIRQRPVYWIFYCRTRDKYQGHGLYKASLSLLSKWARERDAKAEIYIDTEPDNVPSRRAIEAVGFLPKGVITTLTLQLPKLSFVVWGRWDPHAPHPKTEG